MHALTLLAVPNFSEGRERSLIATLARALTGGPASVRLLDQHADADHDRAVFTLAGPQGDLADALLRGAAKAVSEIDVVSARPAGVAPRQHPHVGALDVAPIVYLDDAARGAACAEALVVADRIGHELEVPVFLYGELTGGEGRPEVSRAFVRRGGVAGLAGRMNALAPDFGPARLHPTAGATLVAARAPLVAFNLQLAPPATLRDAQAIAAIIREGDAGGLPGLRAIGVSLGTGVAQVSMNVERPLEVPLARIVEAVARHAPIVSAELVGLAPRAALEGFPEEIPMPGFDPARHVIENALGS
jgi:glutamate formiminotransferase / 5-formyltetrahydrofolate cyclo-ligase